MVTASLVTSQIANRKAWLEQGKIGVVTAAIIELNHEPVGERSEDGTVTAVAEGLPEGELSTKDLLRWMTLENAIRDERMERCLLTLGASVKKEPRIAKWEEGQCPEKILCSLRSLLWRTTGSMKVSG